MIFTSLLFNIAIAEEANLQSTTTPDIDIQTLQPTIDSAHFFLVDESQIGVHKAIHSRATLGQTVVPTLETAFQTVDVSLAYRYGPMRLAISAPAFSTETLNTNRHLVTALKFQFFDKHTDGLGLSLDTQLNTGGSNTRFHQEDLSLRSILAFDVEQNGTILAFNLGLKSINGFDFYTDNHRLRTFSHIGLSQPIWNRNMGVSIEYAPASATNSTLPLSQELAIGTWWVHHQQHYTLSYVRGMNEDSSSSPWRLLLGLQYQQQPFTDSDGDGISDRDDICPNQPEDLDNYEDFDGCAEANPILQANIDHAASEVERYLANISYQASGFGTIEAQNGKFTMQVSEEFEESIMGHDGEAPPPILGSLQLIAVDEKGKEIPHAVWTIDNGSSNDVSAKDMPYRSTKLIVPLTLGTHTVKVKAEGYRPYTHSLQILDEEIQIVHLSLIEHKVTKELQINEKIFFEVGSSKIDTRSHDLLNEVSEILLHHSSIELIHIEGHTDNEGDPKRNKDLSQQRAEAVRDYLLAKGVEPERMIALGYGQERPLVSNDTPDGRAQNRRVLFVIQKRHGE